MRALRRGSPCGWLLPLAVRGRLAGRGRRCGWASWRADHGQARLGCGSAASKLVGGGRGAGAEEGACWAWAWVQAGCEEGAGGGGQGRLLLGLRRPGWPAGSYPAVPAPLARAGLGSGVREADMSVQPKFPALAETIRIHPARRHTLAAPRKTLPVPLPAPTTLFTGGRCHLQRPWGSSSLPPHKSPQPLPRGPPATRLLEGGHLQALQRALALALLLPGQRLLAKLRHKGRRGRHS